MPEREKYIHRQHDRKIETNSGTTYKTFDIIKRNSDLKLNVKFSVQSWIYKANKNVML